VVVMMMMVVASPVEDSATTDKDNGHASRLEKVLICHFSTQ